MDFLGLRNLDVIEDALDIIERSTGERPDMTTLPLDDATTYEMLARGDSIGVFQFESEGMREALKKVRPTEFDDLVALVALYRPGAMDQIPTYARGKRDPESISLPRRAPAPDPRGHQGRDPLPGAGDADRQGRSPASQRRQGRRPAQGDRQEEPRGDGQAQARVRRGLPRLGDERAGDRVAVADQRAVGRLLVQQVARRLLRADRLPHRVAEGQLPGRVHGGADLLGDGHQGQGPVLRRPGARQMGIEILPPDVNLSDHEFVVVDGNIRFGLDAVKGVGYAAVEAIKRAREEGGPFDVAVGLLRARRRPRGQQEGDRGADQVRRVRLDRRDAQGHADGARAGPGRRPEGPAGRADRPGLDLRPGRRPGGDAAAPAAFAAPSHPPIPTRRVRPARAARRREGVDRPVHLRPPAQGRPRGAARAVDCSLAELERPPRRRLGHGRRDDHRDQADPHQEGRPDDVRDARRPRRLGRDARVRQALLASRGARSPPTRSCSSAAASTTRTRDKTCIIAQQVELFEPTEEEVQKAAGARGQAGRHARRAALRLDATALPASVLGDLQASCWPASRASPTW